MKYLDFIYPAYLKVEEKLRGNIDGFMNLFESFDELRKLITRDKYEYEKLLRDSISKFRLELLECINNELWNPEGKKLKEVGLSSVLNCLKDSEYSEYKCNKIRYVTKIIIKDRVICNFIQIGEVFLVTNIVVPSIENLNSTYKENVTFENFFPRFEEFVIGPAWKKYMWFYTEEGKYAILNTGSSYYRYPDGKPKTFDELDKGWVDKFFEEINKIATLKLLNNVSHPHYSRYENILTRQFPNRKNMKKSDGRWEYIKISFEDEREIVIVLSYNLAKEDTISFKNWNSVLERRKIVFRSPFREDLEREDFDMDNSYGNTNNFNPGF